MPLRLEQRNRFRAARQKPSCTRTSCSSRGTPLHELWLEDPDGNLVEIYARLTPDELAEKPENLEPTTLA